MKTKFFITIAAATLLFACTKTDPNLVIITGKIYNPIGESVAFSCKDTTYSTTTNEDGTFEITFSLDSSIYLNFEHGVEITAMYVKPGDKINLTIDTKQFDESIMYEGSVASSFLAKKYLLEEQSDFYGKVFYLSSSEEYKTILDEYKTSLINEFGDIEDSLFIKYEINDIDNNIDYYISRQEKLSEYGKDVRVYLMESREVKKKFNFYAAIDSLNSIEFNEMLKEYSDQISALISKMTYKDYIIIAKEGIEETTSMWGKRKTATDNMPKVGESAIDFTYPDKEGNEFSLSSFKGSLVYVDVWATWCGPCTAQIPALKELEEEYHGKNITFLSVSVDTDKDAWLKMVDEKELGGTQLWADGWSGITKDYAIFGIPRFMLFSADGNVISTNAPRPASAEIKELLDSNL